MAGVLLALVVADQVALRVLPSDDIDHHEYYAPDASLGWTYAKGRTLTSYNAFGDRISLQFDARGFRNWQPSSTDRSRARILWIGDGVTGAIQVNRQDHFIQKVDDAFARTAVPTEGWNLGVNGYSADQALLVLHALAAASRPRVVVYTFVDSQLWPLTVDSLPVDNVDYGKPRIDFDASGTWTAVGRPFEEIVQPRPWRDRLIDHSLVAQRLRLWRQQARRHAIDAPAGSGGRIVDDNPQINWRQIAIERKEHGIDEEIWTRFALVIAAMKKECAAYGAQLIVLPYSDPWRFLPEARTAITQSGGDPDFLANKVARIAEEQNVPAWTDVVRALSGDPSKSFFVRNGHVLDDHMTAAGHAAMARYMVEHLQPILGLR